MDIVLIKTRHCEWGPDAEGNECPNMPILFAWRDPKYQTLLCKKHYEDLLQWRGKPYRTIRIGR
jgi:hypothetical protein